MPAICQAVILPGQIRHESLIFDRWIEESWKKYVTAGTALAMAHDDMGVCTIRLTGPGYLDAKPNLQPGDRIGVGTLMGQFLADGEDIPYGRPYCTLSYGPP